jgi:beta-glucanase (GH16 family)
MRVGMASCVFTVGACEITLKTDVCATPLNKSRHLVGGPAILALGSCRFSYAVASLAVWFWFAASPAFAEQPPASPVALPAGWVLLQAYSDEFEQRSLDKTKWSDELKPWGTWTWDPSMVAIRDGRLRLGMSYSVHERGGQDLYYKGGIVRSNAPPLTYGYFEARIKAAPRWPGVATAFWLFRNTPEYWTEIDIVEMMQGKQNKSMLNYNMYVMRGTPAPQVPVRVQRQGDADSDPSGDFHVFACLWTPLKILFFADGKLLSVEENLYWHQPMDLVLSIGLRKPLVDSANAAGFPTWVEVDYVRVWGPPSAGR